MPSCIRVPALSGDIATATSVPLDRLEMPGRQELAPICLSSRSIRCAGAGSRIGSAWWPSRAGSAPVSQANLSVAPRGDAGDANAQ